MDTLKRLKAMLLLGVTTISLSSCSIDDVSDYYFKDNYRILNSYNSEEKESEYLLVMANRLTTTSFKIIGKFDTFEEAQEYLNRKLSEQEEEFQRGIIGVPISAVLIGGSLFFLIRNAKKEKAKVKSLKKE